MFCALVAGKIPARKVFEDADHIAFFPLKHFNPGHVLLIPRQHAEYVFDMDDGAYHALWTTARRLAPVIKTVRMRVSIRKRTATPRTWGRERRAAS